MKFFIVFIMTLASVHAIFPKLVLKYDSSEEDGSREQTVVKLPKFDLFDKPTLFGKLEAKKDKLLHKMKIADKKEDKFEHRLLNFFEDEKNAKAIFDKFHHHKLPKPAEPEYKPPPPCKCARNDDCDDGYRYFS